MHKLRLRRQWERAKHIAKGTHARQIGNGTWKSKEGESFRLIEPPIVPKMVAEYDPDTGKWTNGEELTGAIIGIANQADQ